MEAMLLSYMYLFIDTENTDVGAGDLATGSMRTGLQRGIIERLYAFPNPYDQKLENGYFVELLNMTDEVMRNYHSLWQTYNGNKRNFTLLCIHTRHINSSLEPLARPDLVNVR